MYNHDLIGSRHNPGETAIDTTNAGRLVEKWRFPARGSDQEIGVIHSTPIVVAGSVYFGTVTDPACYKLAPDGKLAGPTGTRCGSRPEAVMPAEPAAAESSIRLRPTDGGFIASALVSGDLVYFADNDGWIYALDRETGAERWTLATRGEGFPGAHPLNALFASPIMAEGMLICGGGAFEQGAGANPFYRGSTGRGFLVALEPKTGRIVWKYNLGPKPEPLEPPIAIKDSWGVHTFYYGPATSTIWSTPSFDAETGTLFFGTDVNTAPRRPTADDPRLSTRESCAIVARGRPRRLRALGHAAQPGRRLDQCAAGIRPGRGAVQGPVDRRHAQDLYDQRDGQTDQGRGRRLQERRVLRSPRGGWTSSWPRRRSTRAGRPIRSRPSRTRGCSPCRARSAACRPAVRPTARSIFTNGIDWLGAASQETRAASVVPPTGGRVVALSLDTQ